MNYTNVQSRMNYFYFLITFSIAVITGYLLLSSWIICLGFILALLFVCVIVYHYKYGLYISIIFLPMTYVFYIGGTKIFISEAFVIFTIFSFIGDLVIKKKRVLLKNFYTPFIIIFLILLVVNCLFVTVNTTKSILYFIHFLEAFFLFYITLNLIEEYPLERINLIRVITLAALFQSILGILQHFTGGFGANFVSNRGYLGILGITSGWVWHAVGTFGTFNVLACWLGTCLLILLPMIIQYRANKYLLSAFGVILMGFIFTYSRGGLVGIVGGSLFVAYKILSRKSFLIYLTIVILVGSFLFIRGLQDTKYMKTVGYEGRKKIWVLPLEVIKKNNKNFWLGTGSNTYEEVVRYPCNVFSAYRGHWFAHNQYILLWQEFGLLGLGLYVVFWLTVIFRNLSIKYRKIDFGINIRMSIIGIVVLTLCQGYFDHQFSLIHYRNLFFILLALSEATILGTRP